MRHKRRIRNHLLASRHESNGGYTLIELIATVIVLFLIFQLVTRWVVPTFQYYWNGQDQQQQQQQF